MHELPLLIFTLCLQGSVGVTLWLALGRRYAVDGREPRRGALPVMAGAFLMACVGLLASALHMGYPLNALNALRHIASSWLSREIVFASLYLAALGLGVVLLFFRKPGWQPLLMLAAALGLVDVFCMAQIYIHASVVTWQHGNTLALFFGSVGIIGSVIIALTCLRSAGIAMRCAVVAVALLVLMRLIMQPAWLAYINAVDTTVVTFPHHPLQALAQLRDVYLLGWCVSAAGMLCFAAGGLRNARGTLVAGSVLLLIGEIMLRYVFFSIG
ncbi:dimethyl sulfoxide reductase anchor subunit family protein [Salmonella bongori]|uniref:Dimethyl sulfoxide reductase n=1 Tax=Salmonella enterica TaxID=28901 RepID=A0A750KKV0_SALER|nr:dimethyl sulfoxide reductase anchor subunit family protein [Salmonella bongori]EHM2229893.1 dimethyl sulfoxide reductase anchor subunit family protein [Salmonella bongori]EIT4621074.1 dimethyl sulfoxide reductase anchor subunit family protein [Salmonella bongori]MBA2135353.1 dimethyl sulfoxide reductase anchor subunit [Salmonella bongori serovar 66:z39:-]